MRIQYSFLSIMFIMPMLLLLGMYRWCCWKRKSTRHGGNAIIIFLLVDRFHNMLKKWNRIETTSGMMHFRFYAYRVFWTAIFCLWEFLVLEMVGGAFVTWLNSIVSTMDSEIVSKAFLPLVPCYQWNKLPFPLKNHLNYSTTKAPLKDTKRRTQETIKCKQNNFLKTTW